jgi:hypothetical protein
MAIQTTVLIFPSVNVSAQVGDLVYYSVARVKGGFDTSSLATTWELGLVTAITATSVSVDYEDTKVLLPPTGSFIFFQKDKKVNMSSILGYYAQVDFVNDSKEKAELFSVGANVTESSK